MHISQIDTTNFYSKNRILNRVQLDNVKEIADKINRKPSVITHDNNFTISKIGYIESRLDDVFFFNNNSDNSSEIIIGETSLTVDRESGKITKVDKPFFMPFKILLKKANEYFDYFNQNFDNPNAVKKRCLLEQGYVDEVDGTAYITSRKWI